MDFQMRERDDVCSKPGDCAVILPLGRFDTRGEPERASKLAAMAAGVREVGAMTTFGERLADPQAITSIHDAIARLTL